MPTINPALIPTVSPGNLFTTLTEEDSLNIRWFIPSDPVQADVLNRPSADITVRQLIIAKALDNLQLRLSHQNLFPFLITAKVETGTNTYSLPGSWVWDMHVSMPGKWEKIRLAKIKRISGTNTGGSDSDEITGKLRLIFTANQQGSAIEVALFYVDYQIDNTFTYQYKRIQVITSTEETVVVDPAEANTIDGYLTFRTLDTSLPEYRTFLEALAPPADATDSDSDGEFDSPAVYEIASSTSSSDYQGSTGSHGTGLLTNSASNAVPDQDSNFESWIQSSNYPFRVGATRTSTNNVEIPSGIFREFDIVAPSPDEESGDTSRENSPVWVSSIERQDDLANNIKFIFSTHSIKMDGETPDVVEFASLLLNRSMTAGQVVNIVPIDDLQKNEESDQENFQQGFGNGHVVLSSLWGGTSDEIADFFDSFLSITDVPASAPFVKVSSVISSFALSRNPRYQPTKGQFEALAGTTSSRSTPVPPSVSNRFVTEGDQGLGDEVDFRTLGYTDHSAIDPIGNVGGLVHRAVRLCVDASDDSLDYEDDILPRLRCLLGRDPVFGDTWFDGVVFKRYTGDTWVS